MGIKTQLMLSFWGAEMPIYFHHFQSTFDFSDAPQQAVNTSLVRALSLPFSRPKDGGRGE